MARTPTRAASASSSSVSDGSISSRTFTLKPLSSGSSNASTSSLRQAGRAARRLHISSDVLRSCRVNAGDPLLLAAALDPNEIKQRLSLKKRKEKVAKPKGNRIPSLLKLS